MKLRHIKLFLSAIALFAMAFNPARGQETVDGYPVANFAVTANVSAEGDLFGQILQNRGKLGDWLTDLGALRLNVAKDGQAYPLSSFSDRRVDRSFPFVNASFSGHQAIASSVSYRVWAPLGLDDIDVSSLPVLQLELSFSNPSSEPETLELVWTPDSLASECVRTDLPDGPLVVPAGGSIRARILLVFYDSLGYAARRLDPAGKVVQVPKRATAEQLAQLPPPLYDGPEAVSKRVFRQWDALRAATAAFERRIPRTGDSELDSYLRWYMVPGVALTRCTANGKILTLGYCELNQRDSYWASWLHLDLFPSAEKTMILESFEGMRDSGKVPTCLLPRIDRKDDIDINAFFILRCYRYVSHSGDRSLLSDHWEELRKAADWLRSRDLEGTGLPLQTSTWADWKDVAGVAGRTYSPFVAMVYTAAMRRMAELSEICHDAEAQAIYADAADKAYRRLNLPRSEGGLWGGRYYCQLWSDGRKDDRLLQDQMIGVVLGVVPRDRALKIVRSLNRSNLTPYGVCETFPYYPADFGYEPATYHNGGVWPWLSFVDDWGRIKLGRRKEAIRLIKTVARADLVDSGDWAANEHINSLTGENLGFRLQGWNAGLYGLVRFGLCGTVPDLPSGPVEAPGPAYPLPLAADASSTSHGPASGRLMIIGGGTITDELWDLFVSFAGGPGSHIVVITNASGEEGYHGPAVRELQSRVGETNVSVLHLKDIDEANDEALIAPLRQADGVFFTGGRQWRIAEVYLNTRAHGALRSLLDRGGVIGGTSAGASIMGSFLWRGDTRGYSHTIGDHTQGLGFMKYTVIDQHLFVRGRESDLIPFVNAARDYIGIGIDESTAAIVERDSLTVRGLSRVALYLPGRDGFITAGAGEGFDLSE